MATKIRLQRHGKKKNPFYHIVIADSRAKRDGKFIEKIGTYNPVTNPASIDLKFDRALYWLNTGAEPTNTMRAILSYTGVLFKKHLDRGVAKGAFSQEEADKKFLAWVAEKENKIQSKKDGLVKAATDSQAKIIADEKAKSDAKAKLIEAKNTPAVEEVVAEVTEKAEEIAEEVTEKAEEVVAEVAEEVKDAVEEVTEAVEEIAEEVAAKVEEVVEEVSKDAEETSEEDKKTAE